MEKFVERIEMALGAMAPGGPRNLRAYLQQPGPDVEKSTAAEVEAMVDLLLSSDPNNAIRLRFTNLLRSWDNWKDAKWAADTSRNTVERRRKIHELLKSDANLIDRVDQLYPFYHLEEPLIIAVEHKDWYQPKGGVNDYYWSEYVRYLREKRNWDEASLLNMDNSTRAIMECLSDPQSPAAYASRGLVMGYVQSGKTANFTGVVARAADAGYRLIVVLAGTWNILRNQTQRRFDKELLGKELLTKDEVYMRQPPSDWSEFLEHGADPADLGHFTWQRLTHPDIDLKRLKAAIDNLEFQRVDKSVPIYHPTNLRGLPVKLLVIKKHSKILENLAKDLGLLDTNLKDLPALFIDDESDQAGINTADPAKSRPNKIARNITNQRIVELLRLFPRGQYLGYTATPYANALVDPDDPEDLFPKDFIVSLDRSKGYMGVSDFFDPATDYTVLDKTDYSLPEIAYIRRVEKRADADDDDLLKAIRCYVLSGAIKNFRLATDNQRYKEVYFKHHTMLVHTSPLVGEQRETATRVQALWNSCAFNTPQGLADLNSLWTTDYEPVCMAMNREIVPKSFDMLKTHLSKAIRLIEAGQRIAMVVNSDTTEAPDFSALPVWKIIIGGNKLSRGYTVEGLTVSYFRRVAGTADTLMQMGRWFGFRPGYQDLVRVFLGVKDGKKADSDLVSLFKEVCLMEERFREELKRYVRGPNGRRITPAEVPPLITVAGDLKPTAKNKMFNAVLKYKNFSGQRSMQTLAPAKAPSMKYNIDLAMRFLGGSKSLGSHLLGGESRSGKTAEFAATVNSVTNHQLVAFLNDYRWLESDFPFPKKPGNTQLQIEFLEAQKHGIIGWLVLSPQRQKSFGTPLEVLGVGEFTVKERHRVEKRGFQVFGEPHHRLVAEYLTGIEPGKGELTKPNRQTAELHNRHRGIMLLYPVREVPGGAVSIGYELQFPKNDLSSDIHFAVRKKIDKVTVDIPGGTEAKLD